ncbi:SCY1-like protein 2 [Mizuhopecten yessoensis]|uniref:SCY1-like protein 2 n=1 Tax=Mizuhopecten yessoensis TaxID=6573 RepID=UPI000B45737A|nr:SCY1-like protein 2 [Mizuhopecten yessoensis]
MDMFNKIRSAVSSALPGNPLSKDFDVLNQVASGGSGLSWKIYNGIKRTSKQEAAVFVFDKKTLEKYSRRDKEIIIECLKKGVSQLTRLRHPKVLSILHPLEESRETLAFATEPVFASLGNVLGYHDNLPNPMPRQLANFSLYEVEIKHGLLQVAEGISFLHHDVKLLHSNLCPENIIINRDGVWKLFGFECCIPNTNSQDQCPLFAFREWDSEIPPIAQPNLNYLAPEYALTMNCSLASDMFSIGVLIHTIFNKGKPLYECKEQLSQFKKFSAELQKFRSSLLGNVPNELHEYVKLLLNSEPTVRPDPDQLTKIPFFEDVGCMTLQYMDSLFQRDNLQKSQFFKGLPKIISKLPKRVSLQRILLPLRKECVNPEMVPFILPNILQIAEQSTDEEYLVHILPILKPMFKLREPPQIPLTFMQNMNLLLKKTPQGEIKNHVIPMIHQCLEAASPQLQELCLSIVPTFAELIEFSSLKNSIIPRIKKLCLSTGVLAIRTNCLLCIGKLLEYLDKWTVLDDIFPLLPQIPTREPAVLMSILGIYQVTLSHVKLGITKDIMATKVLPFIIPLAMDNNLNLHQFNAYMSVIRDMLGRMEKDQRAKLEQLDQMKQEQQTIQITKITSSNDNELVSTGEEAGQQSMMGKFLSGFGISGMMSGEKSAPRSSSTTPVSSSGEVVKIEEENHQAAIPISQPSKTLSLEEKQKLAKQQEQQRLYKAQKPLGTAASSSTKSPQTSRAPNTGVKDLTSSLMGSNLIGIPPSANKTPMNVNRSSNHGSAGMATNTSMNSSAARTTASVFGTNSVPANRTMGQPLGQSSMGMSGGMGQSSMGMSGGMGQKSMGMSGGIGQSSMGMSGGMGQSSMGMSGGMGQSSKGMSGGMGQRSMGMSGGMGQSSMGMSSGMGQSSVGMSGGFGMNPNSTMMGQNSVSGQKVNMSSFDNLLPMSSSQQPQMSLNQMSQSNVRPPQQQTLNSNQYGMMGSNMGTPMAGMGQMSGMGSGQFGGSQGYMQNSTGMLQPMGSQLQQPMGSQGIQPITSQGMSNNSSSNDLSDIFG